MAHPFFSVVIPTYNRETVLKRTINAVLQQEFQDFEIIVVDDGGNDISKEMIERLNDHRVRYFYKQNEGPLKARAYGCEHANGQWIAFCDSDDTWAFDYLNILHDAATNTKCNSIFCDYIVEGETAPRIHSLINKGLFFKGYSIITENNYIELTPEALYVELMQTQPIMISAFAIEKVFYDNIGCIKRTLDVVGSEDAHLTLRACANGKTTFIPNSLVTLGRGDDNVSSNYIRNLDGGIVIMIDIVENNQIPAKFFDLTRNAINIQTIELIKQLYWQGSYNESISAIRHNFHKLFSSVSIYEFLFKNYTKKFYCSCKEIVLSSQNKNHT